MEPQFDSEDIPSSTPCDGCGKPATWIYDDGEGNAYTLCDTCYVEADLGN